MDLIKIRLAETEESMDREIGKTIDAMFHLLNPKFDLRQNTWMPLIDVYETSDEFIILAEIAGAKSENLQVELDVKTVKIYGARGTGAISGNSRYRLAEIPSGRFERTINLPAAIDVDRSEASYIDGLLKIKMAKRPLNRAYKIPISSI